MTMGQGLVAAALPLEFERRGLDSIKGAIQLKELLEKLGGTEPEEPIPSCDVPAAAPPLFHWLGVAPHSADDRHPGEEP